MQDLENKLKAAKEAREEASVSLKTVQEASQPVRRERGFHLIESQQLRTQIDVCRSRIHELSLLVRAKEREAEEIEDRTRTDTQVYKQKVKHLMHTHRKELTAAEADRGQQTEKQAQEHQGSLKSLESDAQHLLGEYMTNQGHHSMQQKQQKEEYERQTARLREQYEEKLRRIDEEHAQNLETLFEDYELQRINEIHEIQERKDHHIRRLMKGHDRAFKEMRDFYNRITQDQLSSISQNEDELQKIEMRCKEYEQKKRDYDRQISELSRELAEKRAEKSALDKMLRTHKDDKTALANSRARIQLLEHEIESLKHQHGVKEAKFKKMEQERDMLMEKFEASVHDVRQKTEFRALLLEKRVESLSETLQRKEGQLDEMIETANVGDDQFVDISDQVADLLTAKNAVIENLEYELAKATKAHNDLIRIYQTKMSTAGVPDDELVFEPLPSDTTTAPAPSLFK